MTTKLIRDLVVGLSWQIEEAKRAVRPARNEAEIATLLDRKLLEEVGEFLAAADLAERIDEAADVLEVMCARLARMGVDDSLTRIVAAAHGKRDVRGGFSQALVFDLRGGR